MNLIADRKAFNPKIIFTISFVCGLLFLVVLRNNGWQLTLPSWATPNWFAPSSSASASPEDAVYGMLDAARAGNTTAYLAAFSGSMRDQILQVVKENSEPNFSSSSPNPLRGTGGYSCTSSEGRNRPCRSYVVNSIGNSYFNHLP